MTYSASGLIDSIFSKPILSTVEAGKELSELLEKTKSLSPSEIKSLSMYGEEGERSTSYTPENGVGTIEVFGSLITNRTWVEEYLNITSYESILKAADAYLNNPDVNTIFLNIRSGGGAAHKCFETANYLRTQADRRGKKIVAYIDEAACSAAYALASVAHEVIANPSSKTGSIGCVICVYNDSKMLEGMGIERRWLSSPDGKVPIDDDGSFKKGYLDRLKAEAVDAHNEFTQHVAKARNLTADAINATNAEVINPSQALSLGLIDKVMLTHEFYEYLATIPASNPISKVSQIVSALASDVNKKTTVKMSGDDMTPEEIQAQIDAAVQAAVQSTEAKMEATLTASLEAKELEIQAAKLEVDKYKEKETSSKKATLEAKFDAIPFLSESKGALVDLFMDTTLSESYQSLLSSVIDSASAALATLEATTSEKVTSLEAEVATAKAEKEDIKTQFATNRESLEGDLQDDAALDANSAIAKFAAELKASKTK